MREDLKKPCNEDERSKFFEIEKLIGFEVPNVVKKIITMNDLVNNEILGFFSGHDVHSVEQLEEIYFSRETPLSFFGEYNIGANFNLKAREYIEVYDFDPEDDQDRECNKVDNLARFFPLARHQGDYIVVDLASSNGEYLYEISFGYSANLYAPSIIKHTDYVIDGLASDSIEIEEDYLEFSAYWYDR